MLHCKKIQGYNVKLVEQFALRFNGFRTVIARITFQVTKETLSAMMEIPSRGERWYKGMPLDVLCYKEFIKTNCLNGKIKTGVPSQYLRKPFHKLLKVIRKYFTCERSSDRIHSHHIRLLMHFTGKRPLNLPFFLHQSLGGMENSVQAKADQPKKNLSHISLIKLLIVEELGRLGKGWDSFILSTDIPRDPKGDPPLPTREETSHSVKAGIEGAAKKER
jgi:hypothetical protein